MRGEAPDERRGFRLPGFQWFIAAGILLLGAWLLFSPRAIEPPEPPEAALGEAASGTAPVSATVYFGDRDGRTLVSERRDVPAGGTLEARVKGVVMAMAEDPETQGAVCVLPRAARLVRVFHDADSATLYLDFSPELVTRHPGGSAAEWATLSALARTVSANFPEIARLQLLVDGQAVETLAGHFDTSQPLELAAWQ